MHQRPMSSFVASEWTARHLTSSPLPRVRPISQEAHTTGVALVTSCFQELAELYCQRLRGCGLRSSLEPVRPNFSGAGASS